MTAPYWLPYPRQKGIRILSLNNIHSSTDGTMTHVYGLESVHNTAAARFKRYTLMIMVSQSRCEGLREGHTIPGGLRCSAHLINASNSHHHHLDFISIPRTATLCSIVATGRYLNRNSSPVEHERGSTRSFYICERFLDIANPYYCSHAQC